jgi:hypothetical protein
MDVSNDFTRASAHAAAEAGDVEALQLHSDVLSPGGPKQAPPIIYACFSSLAKTGRREGVWECVKLLLQRGADPNTTYVTKEHPDIPLSCLYGAVGYLNDPELATILLEAGANPNDGESLYHSTEHRDHRCLRLLIAHGARFERSNAVAHMLDYEDLEGLRICLDAGADVNEPSPNSTVLHHAILRARGTSLICELLNRGARIEVRDQSGRTPLMLARRLGLKGAIELLAASGAPEDALDRKGHFLAACAAPDEEQARNFLRESPDLMSRLEPADLHVLPEQAGLGRYASVKFMLELGFPVAFALNPAAFRGDVPLVKLLLSHGARWDEKNQYGGNAFGSAIWPYLNARDPQADYLGVVRLLLESGGKLPDFGMEDDALRQLADEFR